MTTLRAITSLDTHATRLLVAASLCGVFLSCTTTTPTAPDDGPDGSPVPEPTVEYDDSGIAGWVDDMVTVIDGNVDLNAGPERFCVLNYVSGDFRDDGILPAYFSAFISLSFAGTPKRWGLMAWKWDGIYARAGARCFHTDGFRVPVGTSPQVAGSWSNGAGGGERLGVLLSWGTAAAAISGVINFFEGAHEIAEVQQSSSASTKSIGVVESDMGSACDPLEDDCPTRAEFTTFYFDDSGTDAGRLPLYLVKNKQLVFEIDDPSTYKEVRLAPMDDAMCYLTYFSGRFDGQSEKVQIYPKSGDWYLAISRARSGVFIKGGASCLAREQRWTPGLLAALVTVVL